MSKELNMLPCPSCSGEGLFYCGGNTEFYIPCKHCGMCSPLECCPDLARDAWNALPRALTWAAEPPKVAGLYYQRWNWVNHWGDADVITVEQHRIGKIKKNGDRQWAGPIPLPKEPTPTIPTPAEVHALAPNASEEGEASEVMDAMYEGSALSLAFPALRLCEMLGHFASKDVHMRMQATEKPCCITGDDDAGYMTIIMPMKVKEEQYYEEDV